MNHYVEGLENRTLCSATATTLWNDEMQLAADSKATIMALRQVGPALRTDLTALKADIKALPPSKTNILLLTKLQVDQLKASVTLLVDYSKIIAISTATMTKVFADGLKLKMKPTDATLKTKLQTDLAAAEAAIVAPSAKFGADMTAAVTTLGADGAALAAANPTATKLGTDLNKCQTDGQAAMVPVQTALAQGGTDLAKFVADLLS